MDAAALSDHLVAEFGDALEPEVSHGLLTVTVKVEGADKALKHEITRENTLTAEELDAWRKYISGLGPAAEPKPLNLGGEVQRVLPTAKALAEVVEFTPVEEQSSKPRPKADRVPGK